MCVSVWVPTNGQVHVELSSKFELFLAKPTCHLQFSSVFKAAGLRAICCLIYSEDKSIMYVYRQRRDSEIDIRRDYYQAQVLPGDMPDSNSHGGYHRSQVLPFTLLKMCSTVVCDGLSVQIDRFGKCVTYK